MFGLKIGSFQDLCWGVVCFLQYVDLIVNRKFEI